MTVQAASLFPFKHDWGEPFAVTREWKTDVLPSNDGSEVRVQLRANPNVSARMRCLFPTEMGAGRLLAQWRGAAQPLRYYAPLWCDVTDLTDAVTAGDAIIPLDTTTRPLFDLSPSGIGYAMLWRSEEFAEVVSYSFVDDTLIVLDAGTVNDYAVAGTRVVPVRPMWLQLPVTVTWLSGRIAQADLSFVDQKEQAGLGLSGVDTTATPASVTVYTHSLARTGEGVTGFVPYELFAEAVVKDALGIPLPSEAVTWTSTVQSGTAINVVPASHTRFARVFVNAAQGYVTATARGGISDSMGVN